jgi:hypothetical protein
LIAVCIILEKIPTFLTPHTAEDGRVLSAMTVKALKKQASKYAEGNSYQLEVYLKGTVSGNPDTILIGD